MLSDDDAGPAGIWGPTDGLQLLRARRGDERVTFGEVADHLEDFVRLSPAHGAMVNRLAAFLAGVERVPHAHHDGEDGSSLTA